MCQVTARVDYSTREGHLGDGDSIKNSEGSAFTEEHNPTVGEQGEQSVW